MFRPDEAESFRPFGVAGRSSRHWRSAEVRSGAHECEEQTRLRRTENFTAGVKAMAERRAPDFAGR